MTIRSRTAAWAALLALAARGLAAEEPASQYSPLAQIRPDNVARLELAWTYRTGEPLVALAGGGRPPAFEATPVYAFGLLYIGTPYGKVVALEPETGKERWAFDAKIPRDANFGDFANRGVSVWADAKQDGRPLPGARLLREHRRAARRTRRADGCFVQRLRPAGRGRPEDRPAERAGVPGRIRADVAAGGDRRPGRGGLGDRRQPPRRLGDGGGARVRRAHAARCAGRFDPLPDNPEAGGANAWSRIVADPERHLVFVPTGSPSPDYYGGLRHGDNRFANSVVALRAATGAVAWHFQTVHHDLWDYDVATPPALFTTRAGRPRAAGRRGRLQDGTPVPARPRDRRTALPRRGAAGAGERRPGRGGSAHAALSDPAARARAAAAHGRRGLGCYRGRPEVVPRADRSRCAPRASSRRRACAARSSCPATSAGSTGAASPSRASRGC